MHIQLILPLCSFIRNSDPTIAEKCFDSLLVLVIMTVNFVTHHCPIFLTSLIFNMQPRAFGATT